MRTLGLLGGMTYHATALYYTQINDHVKKTLNNGQTPTLLIHSVNHGKIMGFFHAKDYAACSRMLSDAGKGLASIGAEALILCVNTSHMWAKEIEDAAGVPLLHIIDFTAEAILAASLSKVALLGTRATMEGDFYKGRLEEKFGLKVLLPKEELRSQMDTIIFGDLASAKVTEETKQLYLETVADLVAQGAQGVILGCTELQFVLKPGDVDVPLFDTVELHARGAADWCIKE